MKTLAVFSLSIAAALLAADAAAQNAQHGADGYKLCASCHGFKGEGNALVNAPALAGQPDWYLERQVRNFRNGVRGAAPGDTHGKVMATMTAGLDSDEKIADVVAYIGMLAGGALERTVDGDIEKGRAHYASCAACHGQNAEGNPTLNAPALTTTEDWYQLRQLALFKRGDRGADAADVYGQQMRPMAGVLADDEAMRDVVAYIASLK